MVLKVKSTVIICAVLFFFSFFLQARVRFEDNKLKLTDIVSNEKSILLDCELNKVSNDEIEGKFVGIYFSAAWCGPCREFTPLLQKFYEKNKSDLEIIWVSLDRDTKLPPGNADKYHLSLKKKYIESSNMNWLTTDATYYEGARLHKKTGNRGVPRLVFFTPTGKYITNLGYYEVRDNFEIFKDWKNTIWFTP